MRAVFWSVILALAPFAAAESGGVSEAARRVDEQSAKAPPALATRFRAMAARALEGRYPDLAAKLRAAMAPAAAVPPSASSRLPSNSPAGPRVASVRQRIETLGKLPTDAARATLATQLASEIQALPASAGSQKVMLAQRLCFLSTKGDPGKGALAAVGAALAAGLQSSSGSAEAYLALAGLIRYEHVPPPPPNAALDAADAVLALRQAVAEEADFTLPGLDGRTYSLSGLKGRVVLVNFWSTSCPPCRKEMPDLEKLHRALAKEGFVVLAISYDERAKVDEFIQHEKYTFPVLLDPDRKTFEAFGVEGIPASFLFDRDGKVTAQAVEMRSARQFQEMLKSAGLTVKPK